MPTARRKNGTRRRSNGASPGLRNAETQPADFEVAAALRNHYAMAASVPE